MFVQPPLGLPLTKATTCRWIRSQCHVSITSRQHMLGLTFFLTTKVSSMKVSWTRKVVAALRRHQLERPMNLDGLLQDALFWAISDACADIVPKLSAQRYTLSRWELQSHARKGSLPHSMERSKALVQLPPYIRDKRHSVSPAVGISPVQAAEIFAAVSRSALTANATLKRAHASWQDVSSH